VIGLIAVDLIRNRTGYFCDQCRRTLYLQSQTATLLLGWWGLLALLFRNPRAIAINLRARRRPPPNPDRWGAVTLEDLADAHEHGITLEELTYLRLVQTTAPPTRSDEVRAAWEDEEIDPSQLDRTTRRALRKAKRL
jgi:hypothetical protein